MGHPRLPHMIFGSHVGRVSTKNIHKSPCVWRPGTAQLSGSTIVHQAVRLEPPLDSTFYRLYGSDQLTSMKKAGQFTRASR